MLLDDFLSDGRLSGRPARPYKLKGALRRTPCSSGPSPECKEWKERTFRREGVVGGIRGSLELLGGVELFKNSPAFVGGAVDFNLPVDTGLYFPFAITNQGVGEWFGWTLNDSPSGPA